jgi:hypothetical protein
MFEDDTACCLFGKTLHALYRAPKHNDIVSRRRASHYRSETGGSEQPAGKPALLKPPQTTNLGSPRTFDDPLIVLEPSKAVMHLTLWTLCSHECPVCRASHNALCNRRLHASLHPKCGGQGPSRFRSTRTIHQVEGAAAAVFRKGEYSMQSMARIAIGYES